MDKIRLCLLLLVLCPFLGESAPKKILIRIKALYDPSAKDWLKFLRTQIDFFTFSKNVEYELLPYGQPSQDTETNFKIHTCASKHIEHPINFLQWISEDGGFPLAAPSALLAYENCVNSTEAETLLQSNRKAGEDAIVDFLPWIIFDHKSWKAEKMSKYRTELPHQLCIHLESAWRKSNPAPTDENPCNPLRENTMFEYHAKVTVYYEAINPAFKQLGKEIVEFYKTPFDEHLDIELVPYGLTKTIKAENRSLSFKCPLGETQCLVNKIHACALKYVPEHKLKRESTGFILCFEKGEYTSVSDIGKCINDTVIAGGIQKCAEGELGSHLLARNGELTAKANPPILDTPWLIPGGGTAPEYHSPLDFWPKRNTDITAYHFVNYACGSVSPRRCLVSRSGGRRSSGERGAKPDRDPK